MKNRRQLLILFILSSLCYLPALAQQKPIRCASMQRVESQMGKKKNVLLTAPAPRAEVQRQANTARTAAVITIPVVVHIVLPNPYLVTNADVQAQIDRLNLDYSGLNPDSTNVPGAFTALRGHAQIQFCLAKRTPTGQLTNGIERRASTTGSDIGLNLDPIKYFSEGGLDAWDPTKYLNYWVGVDATGTGVLGYAQFPNSTLDPTASDGVVINYQAWGSNPCYTFPSYNKGRTAVHETGHYLGLLHTWGDDGGACSGDDFANLTTAGSSCSLPPGLFNPPGQGNTATDVGDTPNQGKDTQGCPTSLIVIDSCSKTAPGIMYQNFMDYSNDVCLSMFTKKQVERMKWVLMNCRSTLLTSQGCQLPSSPVLLDAAPVMAVSPGGIETSGCNSVLYPSVLLCPGAVTPKVLIENHGLTTITSVTVGYIINNGAPVTQAFSVNLPTGGNAIVSFPAANFTAGTNIIKFFTSNPNNSQDQVPSNDTLVKTVTVLGTATLPLTVDFETPPFPPAGWAVDNYNNDVTWERVTPGKNSNWSMYINNYDVDATENMDDFKSPRISVAGADSVIISFDLAHRNYPEEGFADTLTVLVSKDCGATFQSVYKKWGSALATAGSSNDAYTAPVESDWRSERIGITGNILSTGNISVIFRNSSRYGNNVFIDNINIEGKKANTLLKLRGYLVYPTVFTSRFNVAFYDPPTDLKGISVYNSIGQLIYSRSYSGSTDTNIEIDLFSRAAGSYLVRISYEDSSKDASSWVIKQ